MQVRYLVSHPPPGLPPPDAARLHSLAAGLAALARLPRPWQQRCGHLAEQPGLVLESLLMAQQFTTARQVSTHAARHTEWTDATLLNLPRTPPALPGPVPLPSC